MSVATSNVLGDIPLQKIVGVTITRRGPQTRWMRDSESIRHFLKSNAGAPIRWSVEGSYWTSVESSNEYVSFIVKVKEQ